MTIFYYIGIGIFWGIMIPSIFIQILPRLTIKILETLKIYKRGTLKTDIRNVITGLGYYKRKKVYLYTNENIFERFETVRLLGVFSLIFVPICIVISIVIYFLN